MIVDSSEQIRFLATHQVEEESTLRRPSARVTRKQYPWYTGAEQIQDAYVIEGLERGRPVDHPGIAETVAAAVEPDRHPAMIDVRNVSQSIAVEIAE
jgi:hypothetical protein